jgi:hypothetical protein
MKQRIAGSSENCIIGEIPIFECTVRATRKYTESHFNENYLLAGSVQIAALHEQEEIPKLHQFRRLKPKRLFR